MSASSKKKLRKEQNAAVLTEKQQQAQKDAKKLKVQTGIFVAVISVVLAVAIVGLSIAAFNNSGIVERMTDALTVGEHTLTAAELSYFYMDTIANKYQEWYDQFGDSTSMYLLYLYGLDLNAPLDTQYYDKDNNITYADYFAELAVEAAVTDYTIYDLAVSEGKKLSEEDLTSIDATIKDLSTSAKNGGYTGVTDYLKSFYGHGASEKSYRQFLEVVTLANNYKLERYDGLTYTEEQIAEYDAAHSNELCSYSYLSYYMRTEDFVDCTASEDDKDHKHTAEELNAARRAAEEAAYALKNAKPADGDAVDALIKNISVYAENELATCSRVNNLLYSSISNEDYAKWLSDSSRKPGDITIIPNFTDSTDADGKVTTSITGYTFLMFVDRNENNMKLVNVRHILKAFKGGTTDENGNTTYSETEKAIAEEAAKTILDGWVSGGGGADLFAALATDNTDDLASIPTGGLYTGVYPGQMVANFNDWCFAEGRKPGDYGIIETEYGYHVMYFFDHTEETYRESMITDNLRDDEYDAWYNTLVDNAKFTTLDISKLDRDFVLSSLYS